MNTFIVIFSKLGVKLLDIIYKYDKYDIILTVIYINSKGFHSGLIAIINCLHTDGITPYTHRNGGRSQ